MKHCNPLPPGDPRVGEAICYPRPPCGRDPWQLSSAGVEAFCDLPGGTAIPGGPRVIGKGHAGVVLAALTIWGPAAVKVLRLDSKRESLEWEARLQSEASRAGAAPRVYAWSDWFMVSELVEGPRLGDLRDPRGLPAGPVVESLKAARALDAAGILHHEIHRPWENVILTGSAAVIVDYESAGRGCGNVAKILSGLAAADPRLAALIPRVRGLLRSYKRSGCPRSLYEELESIVAGALGKKG